MQHNEIVMKILKKVNIFALNVFYLSKLMMKIDSTK